MKQQGQAEAAGRAIPLNLGTALPPGFLSEPAPRIFLHVGCGSSRRDETTPAFAGPRWRELRFDIDPEAEPDILGSMTDMAAVPSASVDALFSSHNIEHLYDNDVPVALGEFRRVLRPDGFAVITCPDLQSVAALIAADRLEEPAYESAAGPIAPHDIVYGLRTALAAGNLFMAHRCGFTQETLDRRILAAGFQTVASLCRPAEFDLWVVATKRMVSESTIRALAKQHFPEGEKPSRCSGCGVD
jgi:predicted SAM-dependent methyltransferase